MNTPRANAAEEIESLWRAYLRIYGEPQVREFLHQQWQNDPNVVKARIQFDYPPTFQPGYVGPSYLTSPIRLVFLGYNPGEGSNAALRQGDQLLGERLKRFTLGQESLLDLNVFQAPHLINWPVYQGKGIFRETGDEIIRLLPTDLRPSVQSVAILNLFPFKTVGNDPPLAGRGGDPDTLLTAHMWDRLVMPTLELLAPNIVVHYPRVRPSEIRRLATLSSRPTLVRAWHPSDRNVRAQREKLLRSWQPFARVLEAVPR